MFVVYYDATALPLFLFFAVISLLRCWLCCYMQIAGVTLSAAMLSAAMAAVRCYAAWNVIE